MSRRTPILVLVIAGAVLALLPATATGAPDPHAGMDHSQPVPAAATTPEAADPHAGMDHAADARLEPTPGGGSRTLVLAGFGAVNALVLAAALGVRYRDRHRRAQAAAQRSRGASSAAGGPL